MLLLHVYCRLSNTVCIRGKKKSNNLNSINWPSQKLLQTLGFDQSMDVKKNILVFDFLKRAIYKISKMIDLKYIPNKWVSIKKYFAPTSLKTACAITPQWICQCSIHILLSIHNIEMCAPHQKRHRKTWSTSSVVVCAYKITFAVNISTLSIQLIPTNSIWFSE